MFDAGISAQVVLGLLKNPHSQLFRRILENINFNSNILNQTHMDAYSITFEPIQATNKTNDRFSDQFRTADSVNASSTKRS